MFPICFTADEVVDDVSIAGSFYFGLLPSDLRFLRDIDDVV